MLDVLNDPLLGIVERGGGRTMVNLPELMELLLGDRVEGLTAMRAHQRQALHCFLVQLGVMALERMGAGALPEGEGEWREAILALTGGDGGPWRLLERDGEKPAFMQPPAGKNPDRFPIHLSAATPGRLDILVDSKNHEVKQHAVNRPEPQDWIMALISVQTMDNASGSGRKGISRIRNGASSRPFVGLSPEGGGMGAEIRRDLEALREALPGMRRRHPEYPATGGAGLVWTLPWDGLEEESLVREQLDILYIDVSRRVRMTEEGGLGAVYGISRSPRIARVPTGGVTGDPWAPVDLRNDMLLRLRGSRDEPEWGLSARKLQPSEGFSYRNLTHLLFSEEWEHPALLEPTTGEAAGGRSMRLVARCIPRFQGKTFGYLERHIPIGPRLLGILTEPEARREAGEIAMERIGQVARIQNALNWVLGIFLKDEGADRSGPARAERAKGEHARVAKRAVLRLEDRVDAGFLTDLQRELEAPPEEREEVRRRWLLSRPDGVIDQALEILRSAMDETPVSQSRKHRARSKADGIFNRWLRGRHGFPELFTRADEKDESEVSGE